MDVLTTVFTFFLVWWVTLFVVLPLKIEQDIRPGSGHDIGAPKDAQIKYKIKLNTIIALVVTALIWGAIYVFGDQLELYYVNATTVDIAK